MSQVIDMDAFRLEKVTPVSDPLQGQLDLALRLALSVLMPRKISVYRTADARDIEIRQERIKLALDAVAEFVNACMSELNDGLPITSTVDMTDFNAALHDLRSDLDWALERAKELD